MAKKEITLLNTMFEKKMWKDEQEVDSDTTEKVTSDRWTAVCQSALPRQKTACVGDLLQPAYIVEMAAGWLTGVINKL